MIASIAKLQDLNTRLRRAEDDNELLGAIVVAARLAWAHLFDAAVAGSSFTDEANRLDRSLLEAMELVGDSAEDKEFIARLGWYRLLLMALMSEGQGAVAKVIEKTRNGLLLGRPLTELLPELMVTTDPVVVVG